jgi:hypothetical protein
MQAEYCITHGGSYMKPLAVNQLAYYDSFTGLIPCKVVSITGTPGFASTAQEVKLTVTAPRKGYLKGDTIITTGLNAVPRGAVHVSCGCYRIRAYAVETK